MKNSITLVFFTIICVVSFTEAAVANSPISVIAAEILFIISGFTACAVLFQNNKILQPVKVRAYRKY